MAMNIPAAQAQVSRERSQVKAPTLGDKLAQRVSGGHITPAEAGQIHQQAPLFDRAFGSDWHTKVLGAGRQQSKIGPAYQGTKNHPVTPKDETEKRQQAEQEQRERSRGQKNHNRNEGRRVGNPIY
jgi:hypothetical protein